MKKQRLDFHVDKLTNSIENAVTGETYETEVVRLQTGDIVLLRTLKWAFDWAAEIGHEEREVHALVTRENPSVFQGLISSEDGGDHVFMHLLESAPFNKSRTKLYAGVPGNLVAFLCKLSFERGYRGTVVFEPKTRLIQHYEKSLGAKRISSYRMFIDTIEAYRLITRYFPKDADRF